MTHGKTHSTLNIFLKFYFLISYKFFFFTFMAIQNDCRIFYKKGYQKNAGLWLVYSKVMISSVNLITYTSDTISMVQQGPDCKFRKGSTIQKESALKYSFSFVEPQKKWILRSSYYLWNRNLCYYEGRGQWLVSKTWMGLKMNDN